MIPKLVKFIVGSLDKIAPKQKEDSEHLVTGKRGEDEAYFHIRQLGYVIVARNWRSRRRKGEIDLIGWEGNTLCFIEVKTRSTHDVKPAEAAVGREKQKELRAMAREYLWRSSRGKNIRKQSSATDDARQSSHKDKQPICRFDVISVYYDPQKRGVTDITLFRNAFFLS